MNKKLEPVPGRSCGACAACCVILTIDDPDLKKPAGARCRNLMPAGGCSIYESRPQVCRQFLCGWIVAPNLPDSWRPDKSGILLQMTDCAEPGFGDFCFVMSLARPDLIERPDVVDFIAHTIVAGTALYLRVDGRPRQTFLNPRLEAPVKSGNRPLVMQLLRGAL